jgi:hypothetical protein
VLPSAFEAAVTPTSVAPNTAPVPISIRASVRIAGDRSDPPRRRGAWGPGRHARDAGCAANASAWRPDRADPERERRAEHERNLEHRRLEREQRGQPARVGDHARQQGADAGRQRGSRQPGRGREGNQRRRRRAGGRDPGGHEHHCRHGRAGDEHRGLATAVDESPEQRGRDRAADRVRAADRPGDGERAGQALGVDEQRDAEHREREARKDRASEQRAGTGGRENRGS